MNKNEVANYHVVAELILNIEIIIVHLLLLSDNGEIKREQHFTFVRMGNLPTLLPNATPLVSRFFVEISKKRQRWVWMGSC
jgi:hypothetical protein